MTYITQYLKVTKSCLAGTAGCYPVSVTYLYLRPSPAVGEGIGNAQFVTADGFLFHNFVRYTNCTGSTGTSPQLQSICGDIGVDINGYKGPNAFGKDYFRFWYTTKGIVPKGTISDAPSFSTCATGTAAGNGESCTAWVIYNENLDYLKCPNDLSWTGNHTCP